SQDRIRGFQESGLKCGSCRIPAQSRFIWSGRLGTPRQFTHSVPIWEPQPISAPAESAAEKQGGGVALASSAPREMIALPGRHPSPEGKERCYASADRVTRHPRMGAAYASNIQYAPHGAIQQMTLGNQAV